MIVVPRKPNESVVISDGLRRVLNVRIVAVNGSVVTLGFDVDTSLTVPRKEVLDKIRGVPQPPPDFMRKPLEIARVTHEQYACQD